jgi:hypothetical protein
VESLLLSTESVLQSKKRSTVEEVDFLVPGFDRVRMERRLASNQHICSSWPHGKLEDLSTVLPRRWGEMWPEHRFKSALPDGQHEKRMLDAREMEQTPNIGVSIFPADQYLHSENSTSWHILLGQMGSIFDIELMLLGKAKHN